MSEEEKENEGQGDDDDFNILEEFAQDRQGGEALYVNNP